MSNPAENARPLPATSTTLIESSAPAYPKNLGVKVQHPGVHVLNGGIVEHSLDIDWRIMSIVNMDVPARQLFACFAESMLLEFEKLHTNFSWGRNHITVEKMEQIGEASLKHGFSPLLI